MKRIDRRDGNRSIFVVRILVTKKNGHPRYVYGKGDKHHPAKRYFDATGTYSNDKQIKTFHISARNHDQAFEEGKKYGIVQSVQKGHSQKTVYGDIETVLTKKRHNTFGALELEMPWLAQQKEKEREKVRDRRDLSFKDKSDLLLDF